MTELRKTQLEDPDIVLVLKWKENQKWPTWKEVMFLSLATRHYWLYWEALHLTAGVLFKKFAKRNRTGYYVQFLVPRSMRDTILHQMHGALPSGHLGKRKTRARLQ